MVATFLLFTGCIDLNDFDKISKRFEVEISTPLYESTYWIDSLVKQQSNDLHISNAGVYYFELKNPVQRHTIGDIVLGYDVNFAPIQLGIFPTVRSKIGIQTNLFDNGFHEQILLGYYSVLSVPQNPKTQLRMFTVSDGFMQIDITNNFNREIMVTLNYPGVVNTTNGLSLSRSIRLAPNSNYDEPIPLSQYSVDLSKGDLEYNQIYVESTIRVNDPSAINNANNAIVPSNSQVSVNTSISLAKLSSVEGSLPGLQFDQFLLQQTVPNIDRTLLDQEGFRIASPILNFRFKHNNIGTPLSMKATNMQGNLFDGSSVSIPFKNIDQSHLISITAAPLNNANPIINEIILDDGIVDNLQLEKALYDKKLSDLTLDINMSIPEADAYITNYLSNQSFFDYETSILLPLRIDVDGFKIESADLNFHQFVEEVDKVFKSFEGKVTKIVLCLAATNAMPLSVRPQLRVYRGTRAVDSLLVDNTDIPAAQIDINGIVTRIASPKEYIVEIDKARWDNIRTADAIVTEAALSSAKSSKVDYVVIQNDQYVNFQLKMRKLIYSTESF